MKKTDIINTLNARSDRSAWDKGVNEYALELCENLPDIDFSEVKTPDTIVRRLLNGAENWSQYSWGGCSLIYNGDIAERLCSPSEYKKCREGEWRPNRNEEWLDVQARALYQACNRIKRIILSNK